MDLAPNEQQRMEDFFQAAGDQEDKLNDWERKWIDDNHKRYLEDSGGDNGYFLSGKMKQVISKIEKKLGLREGGEGGHPDY